MAALHSGWCESNHHRKCAHHMQTSNGRRPELWCGCDCHDEKAHPLPDQLARTLEDLEHAAGQLAHVDIPDLEDQADQLDDVALRFALDRLYKVLGDLGALANILTDQIAAAR